MAYTPSIASQLHFVQPGGDAGSGVSTTKILVGLGIAAAIGGAIYLLVGRSYTANEDFGGFDDLDMYPNGKTRREYLKGYRAGRRYCGSE